MCWWYGFFQKILQEEAKQRKYGETTTVNYFLLPLVKEICNDKDFLGISKKNFTHVLHS